MRNYPRISGGKGLLLAALAILTARAGAAQATAFETLHSFHGNPDGTDPQAGVIIGKDGALYGTTYTGGTFEYGIVFRLEPSVGTSWTETALHNFSGPDGRYPRGSLVFGGAGALYGTTAGGPTGAGTIFELAPPEPGGRLWAETVLYAFDFSADNNTPDGAVLIGSGGTLYTTTQGDRGVPSGTAVSLAPPATPGGSWTGSVIYAFNEPGGTTGSAPLAGLVSEGGSLYGTAYLAGDENCSALGCGVVFKLTPPATQGGAWAETTIHTFTGPPGDGGGPQAALAVGPDGTLYGTTLYGGSGTLCYFPPFLSGSGCGTVFQLTPPTAPDGYWTESIIYSFTGLSGDGAYPSASMAVGPHGVLYGTTQYGGAMSGSLCSLYGASGCGTVFELTPPTAPGGAWTYKLLHSFKGVNGEGSTPVAGLTLSSTGVLYGTTSGGGSQGKGTVFALKP